MKSMALFAIALLAITGCAMRGVDSKLTPYILPNGDIGYVYQDQANLSANENDAKSAEATRITALNEWMEDAQLCHNGYSIVQSKAIKVRSWIGAAAIYYFIRCKP